MNELQAYSFRIVLMSSFKFWYSILGKIKNVVTAMGFHLLGKHYKHK